MRHRQLFVDRTCGTVQYNTTYSLRVNPLRLSDVIVASERLSEQGDDIK